MVFSLAKVYERRLEQNVRRHRLDVKIAPRKPQPRCDKSIFAQNVACNAVNDVSPKTSDAELMNRFIQDTADQQPLLLDSPTANDSQVGANNSVAAPKTEVPIDYLEMDGCSLHSDAVRPLAKSRAKGLERVDSVESAFFTESESGLHA